MAMGGTQTAQLPRDAARGGGKCREPRDTGRHGQGPVLQSLSARHRDRSRVRIPGDGTLGGMNCLEATRIPLIKIRVMAARNEFEREESPTPGSQQYAQSSSLAGHLPDQGDRSWVAADKAAPWACRP